MGARGPTWPQPPIRHTTLTARRRSHAAIAAERASRRWRTVWRVHFYAGMFAMPFMLLMALIGLVILYTQPIQEYLIEGDLRRVDAQEQEYVSFDEQAQAVAEAYPDDPVVSLTVPRDRGVSTIFGLESGINAYVDPYSGEVLGSQRSRGRHRRAGQPAARHPQQRVGHRVAPHRGGAVGRRARDARLRGR